MKQISKNLGQVLCGFGCVVAMSLIGCASTPDAEVVTAPAPTATPDTITTLGAGDSLGILVFATPIEFPVTGDAAIVGTPDEAFTR